MATTKEREEGEVDSQEEDAPEEELRHEEIFSLPQALWSGVIEQEADCLSPSQRSAASSQVTAATSSSKSRLSARTGKSLWPTITRRSPIDLPMTPSDTIKQSAAVNLTEIAKQSGALLEAIAGTKRFEVRIAGKEEDLSLARRLLEDIIEEAATKHWSQTLEDLRQELKSIGTGPPDEMRKRLNEQLLRFHPDKHPLEQSWWLFYVDRCLQEVKSAKEAWIDEGAKKLLQMPATRIFLVEDRYLGDQWVQDEFTGNSHDLEEFRNIFGYSQVDVIAMKSAKDAEICNLKATLEDQVAETEMQRDKASELESELARYRQRSSVLEEENERLKNQLQSRTAAEEAVPAAADARARPSKSPSPRAKVASPDTALAATLEQADTEDVDAVSKAGYAQAAPPVAQETPTALRRRTVATVEEKPRSVAPAPSILPKRPMPDEQQAAGEEPAPAPAPAPEPPKPKPAPAPAPEPPKVDQGPIFTFGAGGEMYDALPIPLQARAKAYEAGATAAVKVDTKAEEDASPSTADQRMADNRKFYERATSAEVWGLALQSTNEADQLMLVEVLRKKEAAIDNLKLRSAGDDINQLEKAIEEAEAQEVLVKHDPELVLVRERLRRLKSTNTPQADSENGTPARTKGQGEGKKAKTKGKKGEETTRQTAAHEARAIKEEKAKQLMQTLKDLGYICKWSTAHGLLDGTDTKDSTWSARWSIEEAVKLYFEVGPVLEDPLFSERASGS